MEGKFWDKHKKLHNHFNLRGERGPPGVLLMNVNDLLLTENAVMHGCMDGWVDGWTDVGKQLKCPQRCMVKQTDTSILWNTTQQQKQTNIDICNNLDES